MLLTVNILNRLIFWEGNNMYSYDYLYHLMERTHNKYNQFDNKMVVFLKNISITHTEIHALACIGDHKSLNLTQLANQRGISKSAASQMVYRLRDKGLVVKKASPKSDAEIVLSLTDLGKEAYEEHLRYHETTTSLFFQTLQHIPLATIKELENVLEKLDVALDEMLENKSCKQEKREKTKDGQ
jgi:DNA-binding MarR family transcriptional regulator